MHNQVCSLAGVFRTNEVGHDSGQNIGNHQPVLTCLVVNVDRKENGNMKSAEAVTNESGRFVIKIKRTFEVSSFPAGEENPSITPPPPPREFLTSEHSDAGIESPTEKESDALMSSVWQYLQKRNIPTEYRRMKMVLNVQQSIVDEIDAHISSVWNYIAKNDIPRLYRKIDKFLKIKQSTAKKIAQFASSEARKWKVRSTKTSKEMKMKAKKTMREVLTGFEQTDCRCFPFRG
jgi:hypothetical protein